MILTKHNIVEFIEHSPVCSVKHFIEGMCSITKDGDLAIIKKGDTIELISQDSNVEFIGSDAITAIVLALNILEELSNNGCVIIYQINKNERVSIGNETITGPRFSITNDIILKYIDKELMVTDELQKYKERGYLSLNDYNNAESLKVSQKTLKVSRYNMLIAIIISVASIILDILFKFYPCISCYSYKHL